MIVLLQIAVVPESPPEVRGFGADVARYLDCHDSQGGAGQNMNIQRYVHQQTLADFMSTHARTR